MRTARALACCLLLLAGLIAACSDHPSPATPEPKLRIVALLTDNSLALVDSAGGMRTISAGGRVRQEPSLSRRIVLASSGLAWVLVPDGDSGDQLIALDLSSGQVSKRCPRLEGQLRSLSVATSGTLYAVGQRAESIVIYALTPKDCAIRTYSFVHPAPEFDWLIYRALVTPDEAEVLISYHGQKTTGIDRFDLGRQTLCSPRPAPNLGCLRGHGGVELWRDHMLITSGEDGIYDYEPSGRLLRKLDPQLDGNHLMEVAIDVVRDRAYIVGSCVYARGLSRIDLGTGSATVLAPSRDSRSVCGERIALESSDHAIVLESSPVPSVIAGAALHRLDLRTGTPALVVRLPHNALDFIVVPEIE